MNIPQPVLSVIEELLFDPVSLTLKNRDHLKWFAVNDGLCACLLTAPQDNAAWYVYPIMQEFPGSEPSDFNATNSQEPLRLVPEMAEKARKTLHSCQGLFEDLENDGRISVLGRKGSEAVLVINCEELRLVAETLSDWGEPPKSVVLDWQHQRRAIEKSSLQIRPLITTETLVSPDGVLLPIPVEKGMAIAPELCAKNRFHVSSLEPFLTKTRDWPEPQPAMNQLNPSWFSTSKGSDFPTKKRFNKYRLLAVGTTAIAGIFALIIVLAINLQKSDELPKGHEMHPRSAGSQNTHSLSDDSNQDVTKDVAVNDESRDAMNALDLHLTPEEQELGFGKSSLEQTNTGEITIESLALQLQSASQVHDLSNSLSASSLVDSMLQKNEAIKEVDWDSIDNFQEKDPLISSNEDPPEELDAVATDNGTIALSKPLVLKAAITRSILSIDKPVNAKECLCSIDIKLPKSIIVEPLTTATIQGNSKQSWRLAVEDLEPELVLEISSKPGIRWQIIAVVGLRQRPSDTPILINPRDAQNVCNRLILASQWIDQAIEGLKTARANGLAKSSRETSAEIRRLATEQKELRKAIERWGAIAKLSHLFFDEVEVNMTLLAADKK